MSPVAQPANVVWTPHLTVSGAVPPYVQLVGRFAGPAIVTAANERVGTFASSR